MKYFVFKTFIFVLVAIGIFQIKSYALLKDNKYTKKVLGMEVYFAIDKSKKKNNAKKVLLGDSVGKQMFDSMEDNDTVNSLTSNQAISMAGQYLLLNNYIKAGNRIDTAYVFFTPFSFANNLDQIYTYNYFVKPFYTSEYMAQMSPIVKNQIEKIPFATIAHHPAILTSNWSPEYESDETPEFSFLSPVSVEYLHKMSTLGKKNGFQLVLISAPVSKKKRQDVASLHRDEIALYNLEEEFKGYFENIMYLDESYFSDGTHLIHPEKFKHRYKNLTQ